MAGSVEKELQKRLQLAEWECRVYNDALAALEQEYSHRQGREDYGNGYSGSEGYDIVSGSVAVLDHDDDDDDDCDAIGVEDIDEIELHDDDVGRGTTAAWGSARGGKKEAAIAMVQGRSVTPSAVPSSFSSSPLVKDPSDHYHGDSDVITLPTVATTTQAEAEVTDDDAQRGDECLTDPPTVTATITSGEIARRRRRRSNDDDSNHNGHQGHGGHVGKLLANYGASREERRLMEDLVKIKKKREAVRKDRAVIAHNQASVTWCRRAVELQLGGVIADLAAAVSESDSVVGRQQVYETRLERLMHLHPINDCFHIWHAGPFATINGFRLGRLNTPHPVGWHEINACLGLAALVLVTASTQMGFRPSRYIIVPMGSYSKIARAEDSRILYNMYIEESFTFFPRRNFNNALKAYLHCLHETGMFVSRHDPTLSLPYPINDAADTIGGLPVILSNSYEEWTRAMKYMATNLKWVVAWTSKYG